MRAGLPMYDLPELRDVTDAWWTGLARHIRDVGLSAPEERERPQDLQAHWTASDLVITQTCGFPFTHTLAGRVQYLATPDYDADGCGAGAYCSHVMARRNDPRAAAGFSAFRGAIAAINDGASQSGCNALAAAATPFADAKGRFFGGMFQSGAHRASLAAVRDGAADLCAVDCVTLALLKDAAPEELADLSSIGTTPSAPCLPMITALSRTEEELDALRRALRGACADPGLADVRGKLRLREMMVLDPGIYNVIPAMAAGVDRERLGLF